MSLFSRAGFACNSSSSSLLLSTPQRRLVNQIVKTKASPEGLLLFQIHVQFELQLCFAVHHIIIHLCVHLTISKG